MRNARAFAYGMSVTGSRYSAGLWVTGHTSWTGWDGVARADAGKAELNASSSLKVMYVREHRDPAPCTDEEEVGVGCGVSWSNLLNKTHRVSIFGFWDEKQIVHYMYESECVLTLPHPRFPLWSVCRAEEASALSDSGSLALRIFSFYVHASFYQPPSVHNSL